MFDPNSRYAKVSQGSHVREDGREIPYVKRRFLPRGEELPLLAELTVTAEDRADLMAWRTLGVPEAWWLICDANDAMNPAQLLDTPGERLRVPIPQP